MLRESLLSISVEMEASATVATSKGPAAASPAASRSGRVVVGTIFGGRHFCMEVGMLSSGS